MNPEGQQFLNDIGNKRWTAGNRLLPMLDAALYKRVVFSLIFLKALLNRQLEVVKPGSPDGMPRESAS